MEILVSIAIAIGIIELYAWLPIVNDKLLERAIQRLPESDQERCREDWKANFDSLPDASLVRFIHACSYTFAHVPHYRDELLDALNLVIKLIDLVNAMISMTKVLDVLLEKTCETDYRRRVAQLFRDEHFESEANLIESIPNVPINLREELLDKIHSSIQSLVGQIRVTEQKYKKAERSARRVVWLEEHNIPVLTVVAMMLTRKQRLQLDKALALLSESATLQSHGQTRFVSVVRRISAAVETKIAGSK
jgi:hypothetical protein